MHVPCCFLFATATPAGGSSERAPRPIHSGFLHFRSHGPDRCQTETGGPCRTHEGPLSEGSGCGTPATGKPGQPRLVPWPQDGTTKPFERIGFAAISGAVSLVPKQTRSCPGQAGAAARQVSGPWKSKPMRRDHAQGSLTQERSLCQHGGVGVGPSVRHKTRAGAGLQASASIGRVQSGRRGAPHKKWLQRQDSNL